MALSRAGKFRASLSERGIRKTLRWTAGFPKRYLVARWLGWRSHSPWHSYFSRRFDARFGVDTAEIIELPQLISDPRFRSAHIYGPTDRHGFRAIVRRLRIDPRNFTFVDFGCGKGKALLLAAELSFGRIVGVELANEFLDTARRNVARYLARTGQRDVFELVLADARDYALPIEPTVFYLYDPFEVEVVEAVAANIGRSLAAAPRTVFVIYYHPVFTSVFDHCDSLVPVKSTCIYSIYVSTSAAAK